MNRTVVLLLIIVAGVISAEEVSEITGIRSTSTLTDSRIPDRYDADKLYDGDPLTSWVEGKEGAGINEFVELQIDPPVSANIIQVMPGYFDTRYWRDNNRVAKARITIIESGGKSESILHTFEDVMKPQKIGIGDKEIAGVRITILSVYPGDRWEDTCIAELGFYSYRDRRPVWTSPEVGRLSPSGAMAADVGQITEEYWYFHRDGVFEHYDNSYSKPEYRDFYEFGRWRYDNGSVFITTLYRSGKEGEGPYIPVPDDYEGPGPVFGSFTRYVPFHEWGVWEISEDWSSIVEGSSDIISGWVERGPYDNVTTH